MELCTWRPMPFLLRVPLVILNASSALPAPLRAYSTKGWEEPPWIGTEQNRTWTKLNLSVKCWSQMNEVWRIGLPLVVGLPLIHLFLPVNAIVNCSNAYPDSLFRRGRGRGIVGTPRSNCSQVRHSSGIGATAARNSPTGRHHTA